MKKVSLSFFLSVCSLFLLTNNLLAEDQSIAAKWKDGLELQTEDKSVKIRLGGRVLNDWATYASKDDEIETELGEELDDGTEFRSARLYVSGIIYEKLEFKAEYDFAGGDAEFKDVYIGLHKLPVIQSLRAGHFREPMGLDQMTSSRFTTFMERGLTDTFVPGRNNGLMGHSSFAEERATWALGVFRNTDEFGEGSGDDNGYHYTGRLTAIPYKYEDKYLMHIGAAYSIQNPDNDIVRFRNRPEVHLAPRFVDTGEIVGDQVNIVDAELAIVCGSFSLQGEYAQAFVDTEDGSDPSFPSYYVQASYFLTGEQRNYKASGGAFDRIYPLESYVSKDGGPGAWEIAARYSWIDLNDELVEGGELSDVTAGLNWYMHPNARWMLNYVFADLEDVGEAHVIQSRIQVDF